MIELKCWGCEWDGHVPDHFAGLRVICKRCGDANMVPASVTKEIDVDAWIAAVDPESELATVELKCYLSRPAAPPMASQRLRASHGRRRA
jgi:hypothetical protein